MYAINKFFNLWIISIAIIVNRSQSSGKKRNFLQKLQDFQRIPLNFTQKLVNNFYLKNDSHWKYQKCINEQYICVFMPWIELNELLLARFPKFPFFFVSAVFCAILLDQVHLPNIFAVIDAASYTVECCRCFN